MSAHAAKLEGVEEVLKNLNREIERIENVTRQGLIEGGLSVLKQSQKNSPVLTGNMKASASIIASEREVPRPAWKGTKKVALDPVQAALLAQGFEEYVAQGQDEVTRDAKKSITSVIVGFGAWYSLFVHERHPTKPKFLERALREKMAEVLERIRKRAKIK